MAKGQLIEKSCEWPHKQHHSASIAGGKLALRNKTVAIYGAVFSAVSPRRRGSSLVVSCVYNATAVRSHPAPTSGEAVNVGGYPCISYRPALLLSSGFGECRNKRHVAAIFFSMRIERSLLIAVILVSPEDLRTSRSNKGLERCRNYYITGKNLSAQPCRYSISYRYNESSVLRA
ncbi:hypothetical protein EVAR_21715_1 [Eumeta japonica]|uniref:Uncharacterized protein n=1 Tax=Eumeta variegata TaxID=151549 RepID=A0A4C1W7S6_EUMVA|nr:hypothetical protein EVAR_21715_1 [Eumeta japonica]